MRFSRSERTIDGTTFRHLTPPRVLLVEDNALIALDLEELLKGYGCCVIGPSVTVREALDILHSEQVDIAVVDYLLEDGEAEPLARALDSKGIPYAICTGAAGDKLGLLFPNTPILGKPYNPEDVSIVVNSLIASRLANA